MKLVDALRSGRSSRKGVGVRIPPSAFNYFLNPSNDNKLPTLKMTGLCRSVPNESDLETFMATIYQRNGIYYLNYSINGKRVRKVVGNDLNKAEIYLGEICYKLSNGDISHKKPEILVEFFIQQNLEDCQFRLIKNTCLRYHIRNYNLI